jgi:hypothetical protein
MGVCGSGKEGTVIGIQDGREERCSAPMNYGKDTPTQEGRAETLVRHSIWFSPEA